MGKKFEVLLRRTNGRLVKISRPRSKYSAKRLSISWEEKYDEKSYYVEIKPVA